MNAWKDQVDLAALTEGLAKTLAVFIKEAAETRPAVLAFAWQGSQALVFLSVLAQTSLAQAVDLRRIADMMAADRTAEARDRTGYAPE